MHRGGSRTGEGISFMDLQEVAKVLSRRSLLVLLSSSFISFYLFFNIFFCFILSFIYAN